MSNPGNNDADNTDASSLQTATKVSVGIKRTREESTTTTNPTEETSQTVNKFQKTLVYPFNLLKGLFVLTHNI